MLVVSKDECKPGIFDWLRTNPPKRKHQYQYKGRLYITYPPYNYAPVALKFECKRCLVQCLDQRLEVWGFKSYERENDGGRIS